MWIQNMEYLDQILVQTVEDSNEDEEMTYMSIDDRIKRLVYPFKKFKNTQAGQSSKSQPQYQVYAVIYYGFR